MRVICTRKIQSLTITSLVLAVLLSFSASQAMAQDGADSFSKEVPEQTITFTTVNPYSKTSGSMTITFSGFFQATKLTEPAGSEISSITGSQRGTFTFVPEDPSQPTISGKFHFGLGGKAKPQTGAIHFAFRMEGFSQDGSVVTFLQTEHAVVKEDTLEISFGKTERAEAN